MSTTSNNNNKSNISNNNDEVSPLTKLKQGVKKKAESWEEDIVKSMEHAKDKLTTIRTTTTTTTARSNDHQQQRPSTTSTIPSAKTTTTSTSATKSLPVPGEGGEEMATNNNAYNQPTSSSTTTAAATTTTTTTTTMTTSSNNATSSSSSSVSILVLQLLLVTIISISTVYHTWLYQLDILVNHIPVIVAVHWILLAYFIGSSSSSSSDGVKVVFVPIQDNDQDAKHQEEEDDDQEDDAVLLDHTNNEEESSNHHHHVVVRQNEAKVKAAAATKQLLRRIPMGRRHYAKMKAVYLQGLNNKSSTSSSSVEEFFTNLKPVGFITTTTTTTKSPISEKMMNRLLKYPDFRKRKSLKGEIDMTPLSREGSSSSSDSSLQEEEEEEELLRLSSDENEEGEEGERKTKKERMGTAPLVNLRASKLERDFDYVEPLCKFRGMDFFWGDYPEKEIWKQPLLLKNGLRDAATIIGNLMLPHGNLTSYLQMPDWFDDWDNIPEEMEDDPPDVKALKRFFSGDLEYQRKRAKIVPMVVKAPYVVKIIAPNACEMTMHTPRHPVNIKKVNKVVDPSTGETSAAALMEVCVDFYTSAAIGRIINIVMPHLGSITIDVALVIAPPWGAEGAEANEPSACIGVWRIDKVDFMSCAQLPEQPMKVVEEEIKEIMKSLALEENSKLNI